jgi:putative SOS response-associated peptidase YedK
MCFHSSLTADTTSLKHRYKASGDVSTQPIKHASAFENRLLPIVVQGLESKEMKVAEWGLIPSWAGFQQVKTLQQQTPNARIETVLEKPSFKDAILTQRCLVPATGFFEWRHQGDKFPFFIRMKETEIFSMAGIWNVWQHPNGELKTTFSILTTEANETMAYIHNSKKRMPIMLRPNDEDLWLAEGHRRLKYFAQPIDSQLIDSFSIKFNTAQTDFQPHQYAALQQQQLGLF